MRVLYILWESFGTSDILEEFARQEIEVDSYRIDRRQDMRLNQGIAEVLIRRMAEKSYDFVFSFNYLPVVSIACNACQVKYVSWVYDGAIPSLYSNTVYFPYNYIFLFDKATYFDMLEKGVNTVYYLPLAAAVKRFDSYKMTEEERSVYEADISFVGSTYSEKRYLSDKYINRLDKETRGYLDGMIEAQKRLYGSFILEDMLTPDIIKKLETIISKPEYADGFESPGWFYSYLIFARHVTARERQEILEMLADKYEVVLYTHKKTISLPRVHNKGPAGMLREAAYIYRSSRINLNITLRSIRSGIPLRAFDVMGNGGFLLSNYQADYQDYFEEGVDYVCYYSYEDLMKKVEYYLSHEKERKEIAENGYQKIKQFHTYRERLNTILQVLELK